MEGLGRVLDVVPGVTPVDLGTAGATGNRVRLRNATGVTIIAFLATGTAGENATIDLQEHTAASGGTSQDLDIVDHYYVKAAATLDGSETWTRATQSAASEVTDTDWDDANEVVVVIEVAAPQLSDGFEWVSVTVSDPGTAQLGAVLYVLHDLQVQRAPELLAAPQ